MKKILAGILSLLLIFSFTACNHNTETDTSSAGKHGNSHSTENSNEKVDTYYTWKGMKELSYAYITLPNGEIEEVKIEKWNSYFDDTVFILSTDGQEYFVSVNNVLITKNRLRF